MYFCVGLFQFILHRNTISDYGTQDQDGSGTFSKDEFFNGTLAYFGQLLFYRRFA